MKTLKTLFTLLLMTVSMAVSAQTIVAVEKTDGTTDNYNLADVDSVVYEPAVDYGYYSMNATTKTEISSLTSSDYTKLTASTGNLDSNVGYMLVFALPISVTSGPVVTFRSKAAGTDSTPTTWSAGTSTTGKTTTINGTTYNIWYNTYKMVDDDKYATYTIN